MKIIRFIDLTINWNLSECLLKPIQMAPIGSLKEEFLADRNILHNDCNVVCLKSYI
jgi:hypothetical protein